MSQQRIAADLLARAARLRSRALRTGGPRVRAQLEAEALKLEARARKILAHEAEKDVPTRPAGPSAKPKKATSG